MGEPTRSAKVRRNMLILRVSYGLVFAGLLVAVIVATATGGTHRLVVVAIAYCCGVILLGLLGAIVSWHSSNSLWHEHMTNGFYKTLPPVKDDDDA